MKKIKYILVFAVIVLIAAFVFVEFADRYIDYDTDYVYRENGLRYINPEGSESELWGTGVFEYEGSKRINFTIDEDIAKEIGQAVFLSTVRNLGRKHVMNIEIADNYRFYAENAGAEGFKIICTPRKILNFRYSERMADILEKYGYADEIEIVINIDGSVLSFKAGGNDMKYYIDERCALDIGSAIFKRKYGISVKELYESNAMKGGSIARKYMYDTYGDVSLVKGVANIGDEEQEYYEVLRKPRFGEIKGGDEYTLKLFKALIRKKDGRIEKVWLTEGAL